MEIAQTRRAVRPMHHDVEDSDAFYETRIPSSARRYQQSAPPIHHDTTDDPAVLAPVKQRRRASRPPTRNSQEGQPHDPITKMEDLSIQQRFPLVAMLIGMVIMVLLFMTIGALGSWWQTYQDDLHYGRPRTSQMDAVVGHSDSQTHPTHFIFLNLHGHIDIIEMPGGDASHMRVYTGPILYGNGADLVPVTGEVRDVNHDGKMDLIVHVQSQPIIFLNTGQIFKQQ